MAWIVGRATHVSVHKPARTIFFFPIFSIAATKFLSSHAFMDERSMGVLPGNRAASCGHMYPLKLFVSTVLRTTDRSNTWLHCSLGRHHRRAPVMVSARRFVKLLAS